jgi:hypothetical protein
MDDVIAEARATSLAGIAIKLRVAMPDLDLGNTGGRLLASAGMWQNGLFIGSAFRAQDYRRSCPQPRPGRRGFSFAAC